MQSTHYETNLHKLHGYVSRYTLKLNGLGNIYGEFMFTILLEKLDDIPLETTTLYGKSGDKLILINDRAVYKLTLKQ
ncbi:hypothetical protein CQU01_11410 [Cerasibacillus quisquiliarum]|uniref:Uncharacterized protein n=1 Tax=Cerasibacillus quisquiliarum TaxID=227865 RepID=A0A511UZL1_9BACI|nr:hypothetical protein CQU01_11410 [Cerasibacillus quisquiliarum]